MHRRFRAPSCLGKPQIWCRLCGQGPWAVRQALGAFLAPLPGGKVVATLELTAWSRLNHAAVPQRKSSVGPILQMTKLRREVPTSLGQSAGFDPKRDSPCPHGGGTPPPPTQALQVSLRPCLLAMEPGTRVCGSICCLRQGLCAGHPAKLFLFLLACFSLGCCFFRV